MVSRGGRSRGCSNCRRRKVKCDETRPTCLRCKKRSLECDGPRDHAWVDHSNSFTTSGAPELCNTSICRTTQLSLTAFEEDICLAYTRRTFLRGGHVVELACNKIDFQEGSLIFLRRPELSLLRKAILSLSVIFFGCQHHEAQITAKGFNQYGEVLKEFNTALAVPERRTTNETLLTALTCMLLEMFSSTRPVNFLKHQRGIEAIMRLKGPPIDSTGETAMIYRGLRIFSIISALVDSRPSIYVEEDWKHAPVAEQTDLGMLQHEILAVLALCTELTRDRDNLLGTNPWSEHHTSLLARINNTMVDLDALYPSWERINRHQLHDEVQKSRLADDLGIANHLSATVYMLYYTVRICILQLRHSVNPTPLDVELRNDSAAKIATCLELKEYEKRNGYTGSYIIGSAATKVAWQAVGDFDTPEGQRLARAVLSSTHGSHAATVGILSMPDNPLRTEDNATFFAQLIRMATSSTPGEER